MGKVGWGRILRAVCIFWRRSRENRCNIRLALLDLPLSTEKGGYSTFWTQRSDLRKLRMVLASVPKCRLDRIGFFPESKVETGPEHVRG